MNKKLTKYVGKYKKYVILTPLCVMAQCIMELAIPFIMAKMIDVGIRGTGGINYTIMMGLAMTLIAILSLTFGVLGARYAALASSGYAKNLRSALFNKIQKFSFANIDKFQTSSLVTRLTNDVNNAQTSFMMSIRMFIRSLTMLIGASVMAILINKKLSLVFLVAMPILAFTLYLIASKAHPKFGIMLKNLDNLNLDVQENLAGIRVVKSFVREDYEIDKFDRNADLLKKSQVAAEKIIILNGPVMQIIMNASSVAIMYFGGIMIMHQTFEIGSLSSLLSYVTQVLISLMMLSAVFMMMVISKSSRERIIEVLDEEIDIKDNKSNLKLEDGSIEFKNVTFSYKNSKPILKDINLKINSGETIGIIGSTGSSKSSLVSLIPRLFDTKEGEVIVGRHNVKEYSLDNLRKDVSMVLQNNVLFSGTIKENLKLGDKDATEKEITQACKNACIDDFIKTLKDGYDTDLSQGGVNLSGGQKQRLCIARALLKKPKIIILDDSTSAVDMATDKRIKEAFKRNLSHVTTIIIAQRISSISDCDKVIVMDKGRISGFDTNDNLLKNNKIYKEIYDSQKKGDD